MEWVLIVAGVWGIVALLVVAFVSRGARVLNHSPVPPEDTRTRVRGRHLRLVTRND